MGYIYNFIAIAITFGLFYFNAPYWCGKEMYKTSKNGIWRYYYLALSYMGHLLYKICEGTSKIMKNIIFKRLKLNKNKYPTLSILINLLTYIGVITLLSICYDKLCESFVINSNADISTLVGNDKNIFEYIKMKVSFVRIVFEMVSQHSGHSYSFSDKIVDVFVGIVVVIMMWAILLIINTIYFSILYGLLKEKLIEIEKINFFNHFIKSNRNNDVNNNQDKLSFSYLMLQIKIKINDWAKSQTVISNLLNVKVMIAFLPILFGFSSFMYFTGIYKPNLISTFIQILDSINLVGIIISFAITWLGTRGVQIGGALVIEMLPESAQNRFEGVSTMLGDRALEIEQNRHQWAEVNDVVLNTDITSNTNTNVNTNTNNEFDNEPEARAFLKQEFRKKGIVNDSDFNIEIKRIKEFIPKSTLNRMDSFTDPYKIINTANFYKRHPGI